MAASAMAVGETDGVGSEESGSREADVISRGNILESFTESQEVRALLGNLRTVCGDPVAQEVIVEKFIGEALVVLVVLFFFFLN